MSQPKQSSRPPSAASRPLMNTQPSGISNVLTGAPLEQLRHRNMEEMAGGAKGSATSSAIAKPRAFTARGKSTSPKLFGAMGIARRQADAAGLGAARLFASSTRRSHWC